MSFEELIAGLGKAIGMELTVQDGLPASEAHKTLGTVCRKVAQSAAKT